MIDDYTQDGETYQDSVYYPEDDKDQKAEIAKQQAVIQSSYPILKDVLAWFDEQIENDSIDNIQTEALTVNGVQLSISLSIEAQVFARKLLKTALSDKKKDFVEKFEVGDER